MDLEITFEDRPVRVKKPRKRTAPRERPLYVVKDRRVRSLECVSCGAVFTWDRDKSYCTNRCKSVADVVRYRRGVAARYPDGPPEDVQLVIRTLMALTLGGGYDSQGRHLSPERRTEVWLRDKSQCVLCSAPGEEIDHINGSNDDLSNLRLLCKPCHHEITESHFQPIAPDDVATLGLLAEINSRVESPEPLRPCDAATWSGREVWRTWVREHERPVETHEKHVTDGNHS